MAATEVEGNLTEDNITFSTENQDGDNTFSIQKEAGPIQALDKQSVHRICSGQVVLTLATAVKELVENSIDAGATTVDIKLKEYGSESIEVSDNGSGVEEHNFFGLTQKHHTSKLSDFSDLINVETFGFRGEALSSLCALSNMTVTTRHRSVAVGTKLEYDANGHIKLKMPTARQQGTTVLLGGLFHTLPVRHKEFLRNLKKEFSRMVQVLNAYCLINTGVRITCYNQTAKGSRSTVVSTNGNATVKDNISNIFGPKQLQSLLPFEQRSPTEDVCADYGIHADASHLDLFRIEGFVSKCEHGQGRSSSDRQFIFINRRPCDSAKILKVINEVYHSYNRHQNPFVVLLISMAKESVDVNVTPDKRQIFLEGEKILLATIKTSLVKMYEPTTSVLRVNLVSSQAGSIGTGSGSHHSTDDSALSGSVSRTPPEKFASSTQNDVKDGLSSLARLKRSFSSAFDKSDHSITSPHSTPHPDKKGKLEMVLTKGHSTPARLTPDKGAITWFFRPPPSSQSSQKPATPNTPSVHRSISHNDFDVIVEDNLSDSLPLSVDETDSAQCDGDLRSWNSSQLESEQGSDNDRGKPGLRLVNHELSTASGGDRNSDETSTVQNENSHDGGDKKVECSAVLSCDPLAADVGERQEADRCDIPGKDETVSAACVENMEGGQDLSLPGSMRSVDSSPPSQGEEEVDVSNSGKPAERSSSLSFTLTQFDHKESQPLTRPATELRFSFQQLRKCLTSPEMTAEEDRIGNIQLSFRAQISPADNKSAEEELQREISKDMFAKMDILGQFNLGFIIAKHGEDLFIVDQHATDEKYNFEILQRHTVLQSQQLIHPQSLELTASNEIILIDNLDIFRKNGFDFIIDETAPPTQRVKLKSTPVSKNWSFGKDDIEELIFMLTDSPGIMCRPSRVRMMFASRACRKSVMIGTHLNKPQMKKLLCHMGEIEQPWNCPHGRPTMRHLLNLRRLPR